MSNKGDIQEMLISMGFQANYIQRAFKVYEKNYGHSYNVEVITEIIVRLQNKDKSKQGKKGQSVSPSKKPQGGKQSSSAQSGKKKSSPNKSSSKTSSKQNASNNSPSKPRVGGSSKGNHHHSPNQNVNADEAPPAYSQLGSASHDSVIPSGGSPISNMENLHRSRSGGSSRKQKNARSSPKASDPNNSHYSSSYNGSGSQRGHHQSRSQQFHSPQQPMASSQTRFKRGDVVLYNGSEVEIHRMVNDQMVEISYPIHSMQRRQKTVGIGDLQQRSHRRHGAHGNSQQYSGQTSPRSNGNSRHQYSQSSSQSSMGSGIPSIQQINGSPNRQKYGLSGSADPIRSQQSAPVQYGHNNQRHPPSKTPPPNYQPPNKSRSDRNQQQQININMNAVNLNTNDNENGSKQNDSAQSSKSKMPPFESHMTLQDAFKLKIHDKIDHRDQVGRFVFATVSEKQGTNLKIHYDGWSRKWDTWSDFGGEIHRFAAPGSISKRPAHRFEHLKKGDYVDINPTQRHPGWKCGEIRRLDQKSGQVQVVYESMDKNYLYWAHLDNTAEIAEFTSQSGTVHQTQVDVLNQSDIGSHKQQQSMGSIKSQRGHLGGSRDMGGDQMGGHGMRRGGVGGRGGHNVHHSGSGIGAAPMDEMEAFQRIRAKRFPRVQNERIANKYGIGDWLEVQDTQTLHWITATVIDRENNWIVVHFDGWPSKYDQKIHVVKHGKRLRDLGSGLQETQEEKDIKEEMASFLEEVKEKGLNLEVVDADGNCLYRCFATQIYGDTNLQSKVRAECCQYMRSNDKFFKNFIPDFEVRMKEKEQEYEWGDHVDITALSELYNVRVRVFEYDHQQKGLYRSFDQGEGPETGHLPLILLARHRKKHYNIINDPKAKFKRPLKTAEHRKQQAKRNGNATVSLRQLRLNEDAKVEEHHDDEKDNGDDNNGNDDADHVDIDNASLIHSKSISRHNSQHGDSYSYGYSQRSSENDAFTLHLTLNDFETALDLFNLSSSGTLKSNDIRTIFSPLMKELHRKIEYQWESNHKEVNKQILDRFWSGQGQETSMKKWITSLKEKIPSGKFPVKTAMLTFNQVIVNPMASNLGHIVKTRKRQSTIDPFRAQQAMQQYHAKQQQQHLHHDHEQQHAMDLDDD